MMLCQVGFEHVNGFLAYTQGVRANDYIAKRIRMARVEAGLSQRELGERLGMTGAAISDYERGKVKIGIEDLDRFARALDKDVTWFLPDWYIDPRGLPPEIAQLVHRINALPDGPVRDALIRNFMEQVELVERALGDHVEDE